MADSPRDTLKPLPDIKQRRKSSFVDEFGNAGALPQKILKHWNPMSFGDDDRHQIMGPGVQFAEKFDDEDMGRSRPTHVMPSFAMPRKISLADMTDILQECVDEHADRRESMAGKLTIPDARGGSRRGSIHVRKPSMDVLEEAAAKICMAVEDIVNEGTSTEDGEKLMTVDLIAETLDNTLPDVDILDMEEDFVPDEYVEPIEELTVDDAKDTWSGMIDTSAPPKTAGIPQERPIAKQITDAIDDLTADLGNIETQMSSKLNALSVQRPQLTQTAQEIQDDMAEFINKLQEKLSEKSDVLDADAKLQVQESNAKAALLREEQDRLDEMREQQALVKQESQKSDQSTSLAHRLLASAKQAVAAGEDAIKIPEPIRMDNEVEEVMTSSGKKDKKEKKKKKKDGEEGEKKKKKKKSKSKDTLKPAPEAAGRRRKTSTNKLTRLRTKELADVGPEQTPAPEKSITVDEFLTSAGAGRPKAVLKYIMDGGDINKQDAHKRTALQKACLYGEAEIIDVLMAKKARVNLSDKLGDTALHWAARGGHPEVVIKLVKAGAKINAKDKLFSTPLHVAVRCGVQEVVDALIELGAEVNAKDREGDTPMHDAVRLGRFKLIKTLLAAGANLRQKNMRGQTAIDMVQLWYAETKSHHAEIILQALTAKAAISV